MYDSGRGTAQDYGKALQGYRAAAEDGNSNAMFAIGNLYANGFGVGKDLHEATRWYCKAAVLGHPQATTMVGEDRIELECGESD